MSRRTTKAYCRMVRRTTTTYIIYAIRFVYCCFRDWYKHIWSKYLDFAEDIRHTPKYKKLYEKRKETIERVFADAKEKYGMRYTLHRGLSHVTNWVRLKFAAMNLKKFAIRR